MDDVAIVTPALRSVGNIVTGDDRQTDAALAANVLPKLVALLEHKKANIIKVSFFATSLFFSYYKLTFAFLKSQRKPPGLFQTSRQATKRKSNKCSSKVSWCPW